MRSICTATAKFWKRPWRHPTHLHPLSVAFGKFGGADFQLDAIIVPDSGSKHIYLFQRVVRVMLLCLHQRAAQQHEHQHAAPYRLHGDPQTVQSGSVYNLENDTAMRGCIRGLPSEIEFPESLQSVSSMCQ